MLENILNDKEKFLNKNEKLISAIYIVTKFLNDNQSLKINIRKEADEFLRNINFVVYKNTKEDQDVENILNLKNAKQNLYILISYFNLAKNTQSVSPMNSDLILNSLKNLKNILEKNLEKYNILEEEKEKNIFQDLQEMDFKDDLIINSTSPKSSLKNKEKINPTTIKSFPEEKEKINPISTQPSPKEKEIEIYKRQNFYKRQNKENKKIEKRNIIPKINKIKERKEVIKDTISSIILKNKEISINDILKNISGYSIKSLQRILIDMINEKKIKKIGNKKWTKYVLF